MLVTPPHSGPKNLFLPTDLRIWQKDRRSATDQKIPVTQLLWSQHRSNVPTIVTDTAAGQVEVLLQRAIGRLQLDNYYNEYHPCYTRSHHCNAYKFRIQDAHASCVLYHGKWQALVSKSNTRLCNMLCTITYRIAVCK